MDRERCLNRAQLRFLESGNLDETLSFVSSDEVCKSHIEYITKRLKPIRSPDSEFIDRMPPLSHGTKNTMTISTGRLTIEIDGKVSLDDIRGSEVNLGIHCSNHGSFTKPCWGAHTTRSCDWKSSIWEDISFDRAGFKGRRCRLQPDHHPLWPVQQLERTNQHRLETDLGG